MRNQFVGILVILGMFASTSAYADQVVRTGKSCKEHISAANLTPTIASALQVYEGSTIKTPGTTPLKHMQYNSNMSFAAKNYVKKVASVLNGCEAKCEGLILTNGVSFKCEQLKHAAPNNIHSLTKDNTKLMDSAILHVADTSNLEGIFPQEGAGQTDAEAGEDNSQISETPKKSTDSAAGNRAYQNHWINRADAPKGELIEL